MLNMRERLAPFLGGLMAGVAVGMLLLPEFMAQVASDHPLFFIVGLTATMFVAGVSLGRKSSPKPREMKLTGRVFDFPQGSVMVEVALRRMKSILPTKVTQE